MRDWTLFRVERGIARALKASLWKRFPLHTALLIVTAGLIYILPGCTQLLIYDRTAIFAGESWRLVTGHWVHYSPSHLAYNLVALTLMGTLIELQESRRLLLLCLVSSITIGLSLLVFRPDLDYFAGASGIISAAVVYYSLREITVSGPFRTIWFAVLVLLVGKIVLESFWPGSSLVGVSGNFVVIPLSHAVGAVSGLFLFFWWRWRPARV